MPHEADLRKLKKVDRFQYQNEHLKITVVISSLKSHKQKSKLLVKQIVRLGRGKRKYRV